MGFVLTKTLFYLILPPASLLVIMAFGFLIVKSCRGFGRFLISVGFILLYLLSINPVSDALLRPLEKREQPWKEGTIAADAIVVLGGGTRDLSWVDLPAEPSASSLERIVKGITIYRKLHLPLVFMGGNGDPSVIREPDADAMARTASQLGVPGRVIAVENKSRNTLESAQALKGMLKGTSIILVTSASHLTRATAMFRKQGFHVIPAPAGYLYERKKLTPYSFIPHAGSLAASSTAIAEYVSLSWYFLIGAI